LLSLKNSTDVFVFKNQKSKPVPSLLREFSAPVILRYPYTEAELLHLMGSDDDPFNRWEAGQRLFTEAILDRNGQASPALLDAARRLLAHPDAAFAAEALALPAESFLAEQMDVVDPDRLHESRNALRRGLAASLKDELRRTYDQLKGKGPYSPDPASIGR